MPPLSRWFICSALAYLALGTALGAALLVNKAYGFSPLLWALLPLHYEWLLLGWTLQLAFGVAFWIMPRFGAYGTDRGRVWLAWLSYALLNGSLAMATWSHLLDVYAPGSQPRLLAPLAGAALLGAASAYATHLWPRVRGLHKPVN